jgi:ankyrin repeat protein
MAFFLEKVDSPGFVPPHMKSENQLPSASNSALFSSAASGNLEQVKAALSAGGSPNYFNPKSDGATALHAAARACTNDAANCVRELLANGAVLDAKTITTNNSPLHEAILANNQATAEALIAAGALFTENSFGNTPLLLAVQQGNISVALSLIKKGHTVSVKNNQGRNALHICANMATGKEAFVKMAACLIMYGVDASGVDNNKYTPLHAAASVGNLDMVQLLADSGAALSPKSHMYVGSRLTERTPFEVADLSGHDQVARFLDSEVSKESSGQRATDKEVAKRLSRGLVSEVSAAAKRGDENSNRGNGVAGRTTPQKAAKEPVFVGSGAAVAKGK